MIFAQTLSAATDLERVAHPRIFTCATGDPGEESSCRKPGLWLPHSAVSLWLGCKAGHVAGCNSLGTSKESLVRWV